MQPKITVFSDFLCPFCYIGKKPLDQVAAEKGMDVEWKSFELRPEGVEMPPRPPEYMENVKAGVENLSRQFGLEMSLNRNSKHSRKAHEGAKFAEAQGKAQAYHEAVFVAQFQQEKNIDDMDTLVEIARSIELDPDAFREAVDNHQYEQAVVEDERLAEQIGVTGIPCIIVGNQGAMGVQTVEQIQQMLES